MAGEPSAAKWQLADAQRLRAGSLLQAAVALWRWD